MSQIRVWIERMPRHIQEVIRLEGGNEYKEGRSCDEHQRSRYKKDDRRCRYEQNIGPDQRRIRKKRKEPFPQGLA